MEKLEALLDWGGTRKDVACLVLGGAALLASAVHPGLGFAAFLVSNIGWLTVSAWQRQWPLHVQQWVFLACSLLGLWNWWLGPLVLG